MSHFINECFHLFVIVFWCIKYYILCGVIYLVLILAGLVRSLELLYKQRSLHCWIESLNEHPHLNTFLLMSYRPTIHQKKLTDKSLINSKNDLKKHVGRGRKTNNLLESTFPIMHMCQSPSFTLMSLTYLVFEIIIVWKSDLTRPWWHHYDLIRVTQLQKRSRARLKVVVWRLRLPRWNL